MIFLRRYTTETDDNQVIEIAVVEQEHNAAPYETQGFVRCSFDAFREAWQLRDMLYLEHLRTRSPAQPTCTTA